MNRRLFIGASLALSSSLFAYKGPRPYIQTFKVFKEPYQSIALVYDDIFPSSDGIPGASEINAVEYLHGAMNDNRLEESEKKFIINGEKWLNETAVETYNKKYNILNTKQRERILNDISDVRWGENWLWTLQSYLLEALLSDPIYGSNEGREGWLWLGHISGYPRPKEVIYE